MKVLFAGAPGTGKAQAAEVIATELQMALMSVDLAAVASKFIGETEKNIDKLFDSIDAPGVILLFDEADALFGKRSDVKDAHDRNAINDFFIRLTPYYQIALALVTDHGF